MATRMVEFTGCRDRLCSGDRPTGEDAGGERVPRLRRSPRGQPEEPHGHRQERTRGLRRPSHSVATARRQKRMATRLPLSVVEDLPPVRHRRRSRRRRCAGGVPAASGCRCRRTAANPGGASDENDRDTEPARD